MKSIKKGGLSRRLSIGVAGAKGGLGLLQAKAGSLLLPKDQQQAHNDKALEREAKRFVEHLGELKGAYVKIGQMLALYGEHILPVQVTSALHTLESSTTPLDWGVMRPVLVSELGQEVVSAMMIDQQALAAASLSQVHKARFDLTKANFTQNADDESAICIKIQYPEIANAIEDDFKNMMQMLALARWVKSGRQMESLTKELKHYLVRETNYRYELETASKVGDLLRGDNRYQVPHYYEKACTKKVLTMEYVDGVDVTDPSVQSLSQKRRNALAESMLELFFKEAFEWRLMQTDPNFGNYRISIDNHSDNDKLVLLDFGAVHELSESFSKALQVAIMAAQEGDTPSLVEGLIALNCLRQSDSEAVKKSFAEFCQFILEPFKNSFEGVPSFAIDGDVYHWKASRLLKRAGRVGSQGMLVKGFTVPPSEFMLMVRKLTGVFTFVSALGAKTKSAHLLNAYREIKEEN